MLWTRTRCSGWPRSPGAGHSTACGPRRWSGSPSWRPGSGHSQLPQLIVRACPACDGRASTANPPLPGVSARPPPHLPAVPREPRGSHAPSGSGRTSRAHTLPPAPSRPPPARRPPATARWRARPRTWPETGNPAGPRASSTSPSPALQGRRHPRRSPSRYAAPAPRHVPIVVPLRLLSASVPAPVRPVRSPAVVGQEPGDRGDAGQHRPFEVAGLVAPQQRWSPPPPIPTLRVARRESHKFFVPRANLSPSGHVGRVAACELRLRGLAARTLILVPVGLVEQWQQELDRKFGLPSVLAQDAGIEHATGP